MTYRKNWLLLRNINAGLDLLTLSEKKRIWLLSVLLFLVNILDMVAISSIMPIIGLIIDPELVNEGGSFHHVYVAIGSPEFSTLLFILLVLAVSLLVISSGLKFLMDVAIFRFTNNCGSRLGKNIMKLCVLAPYQWLLKKNSATIARLLYSDIPRWSGRFLHPFVSMIGNIITIFVACGVIVAFSPLSGIVAIVLISFLAIIIMKIIRPYVISLSKNQRELSDQVAISSTESIAGIKDIKLTSKEGFFVNRFSDSFHKVQMLDAQLRMYQMVSPTLLLLAGQLILIIVGGILYLNETPTAEMISIVALLVLLSSRLIPAVNKLSNSTSSIWDVLPYCEGIGLIISETMSVEEIEADIANTLSIDHNWKHVKLENISFNYSGTKGCVLDNINLTIEKGKSYGVVGSSGAGKSTLVDILLGLLEPTSGNLMIDDEPLNRFNVKSWQGSFGYVPQAPYMIDASLRANVAFGVNKGEVDDNQVMWCLERAHLGSLITPLDEGLDTKIGEQGLRLSGGQRQRIAIARAFYNDPNFLVFDEATSALDSISEKEVQDSINDLIGKVTMMIIAHRISTLRHCEKIIVMDKGAVVAEGSFEYLKKNCVIFKNMLTTSLDGEI